MGAGDGGGDSGPPTAGPDVALEAVATLAHVAAQPTAAAREIHRLHIHAGRLYEGHGDWDANTGPTHMLSLDLTNPFADPVDEITLQTEAVWNMRTTASGRMLVSYIDPSGFEDPAQGALGIKETDGSWTVVHITDRPPVHDFSALERANGDLVIVGADNNGAAAWISTGGAFVGETICQLPSDDPNAGVVRAFTVFELGGTLHAYVQAATVTTITGRWTRDNAAPGSGTWTKQDTEQFQSSGRVTIGGTDFALLLSYGPAQLTVAAGSLRTYPADLHPSWATENVYALNIDRSTGLPWWLTSGGVVYRGNADGSLTNVMHLLDSDAVRCLAVDSQRGFVYFGTTDGSIVRAPIPEG